MLKKIKIVISTLCLGLLVGCSSTVSWENNINKDIILLKNNGFHTYISNSKEDLAMNLMKVLINEINKKVIILQLSL